MVIYRISTLSELQALSGEILRRTTLIYWVDHIDIFLQEIEKELTTFKAVVDYAVLFIEDTQNNNKDLLDFLEQHNLDLNSKQSERIILTENGEGVGLDTIDWLSETYKMCNQGKLVIIRPRARLSITDTSVAVQEVSTDV